MRYRLGGLLVEQLTGAGEQQLQMVIQLGHGAYRRTRTSHRVGLVNRNSWRHALDLVHCRAVHAIQKLTRISAEGFDITALTLGVQSVKHQAGFARTAGAGEHRQLVGTDVYVYVFEIVLTGTAYANKTLAHTAIIHRGRRRVLSGHAAGLWPRPAC